MVDYVRGNGVAECLNPPSLFFYLYIMSKPAEHTPMKFEYDENGHIRSISATVVSDRVASKLISQGIHPEVADFVEENLLALICLKYSDERIEPNFVFDGERITESAAKRISYLRQYLKPNESLAYVFENVDHSYGPRFKPE